MGQKVIENVEPLRTAEAIQNMREALDQSTFPKRNNLLFSLGINTGLRIGDLLRLRIEDVKGKSSVEIQVGKTSKTRSVHLDAVMTDLADYLEGQPDVGVLFPSQRTGEPISTVQAYRILKAAGDNTCSQFYYSFFVQSHFGKKKLKDVSSHRFLLVFFR